MNAAGKKTRTLGINPRHAAQSHEHGCGGICLRRRCIGKKFRAQFLYRPGLLHRGIDQQTERRKLHEGMVQARLQPQAAANVPVIEKRPNQASRLVPLAACGLHA